MPAARATQDDATIMAMRVQLELIRLGFYKGKVDGKLGGQTKEALKTFQRSQALPQSGVMDNSTIAKLGLSR